jgi:hypothetical protein
MMPLITMLAWLRRKRAVGGRMSFRFRSAASGDSWWQQRTPGGDLRRRPLLRAVTDWRERAWLALDPPYDVGGEQALPIDEPTPRVEAREGGWKVSARGDEAWYEPPISVPGPQDVPKTAEALARRNPRRMADSPISRPTGPVAPSAGGEMPPTRPAPDSTRGVAPFVMRPAPPSQAGSPSEAAGSIPPVANERVRTLPADTSDEAELATGDEGAHVLEQRAGPDESDASNTSSMSGTSSTSAAQTVAETALPEPEKVPQLTGAPKPEPVPASQVVPGPGTMDRREVAPPSPSEPRGADVDPGLDDEVVEPVRANPASGNRFSPPPGDTDYAGVRDDVDAQPPAEEASDGVASSDAGASHGTAPVESPRRTPPAEVPMSQHPIEERQARRPLHAPPPRSALGDPVRAAPPAEKPGPPKEEPSAGSGRSIEEWRRLLGLATSAVPVAPRAGSPGAAMKQSGAPGPAATSAPNTERSVPAVARAAVAAPATPLLPSTRRFLKPHVGIDPDTVRVVRGPLAGEVTDAARADAAAIGDVILLPDQHDERTPATRALLAHELTHVAASRSPRFVPPAARRTAPQGRPVRPIDAGTLSAEERLARDVEWAVRDEAEGDEAVGEEATDVPAPAWAADSRGEGDDPAWGGLPAPWEPMPSAGARVGSGASAEPGVSPVVSTGGTDIQYAGEDRPLGEGHAAETASHQQASRHHESAPAPDLDVLARKVYDNLKRRLAAERRREG